MTDDQIKSILTACYFARAGNCTVTIEYKQLMWLLVNAVGEERLRKICNEKIDSGTDTEHS